MKTHCYFLAGLLSFIAIPCMAQWKGRPVDFSHGTLKVSDNKRFLQHKDGTPFFYLGDTAWELFHRLDRKEADIYLEDRAKKGYTVIQAVAIAELDGHKVPNPYGYLPFVNMDPAQPAVKDGSGNDYWDHVDYIVDKANVLGMYIGFLPTWGRYWHDDNTTLFNRENARIYGEFLGKRCKGSSQWFHQETWLDFNMRQNGHNADYTNVYSNTIEDYRKQPAKPVIDGEPLYEDHPLSFNAARLGHSVAADVRRPLNWDLFNGAFGHTYGHHSVWQMYDPQITPSPKNNPLMSWQNAIHQPGAGQMMYGRLLMESRPFLTRIPDPSIIVAGNVPTAVPGEGRYRFVATRDEAGTYAMIYVPVGREFTVRTEVIKGIKITAWWYNPRNGKASKIGTFDNDQNELTFISPEPGELTDWVLVLDDAAYKYPSPGKAYKQNQ